ncbi:colicin E3-like toxin immunity protein (plasmid) [Edwardsiella tarda]|uniref:colicin E3-like toxin immunity protein n=1 Tax=Edwardsiella tarda TaxID=636 RepID=UPI0024438707|nr:colicin E3-like toxin immunity protein [Edwardsiella tarda]WGE30939.1 colicin E3-like toxin immunity protein [Edwardsiella tarda]WGE31087.1 colicin E3-like toxin immunity protein [Edwardsiella tarda]
MGLKLRLEWFDKKTDLLVNKEYSSDFGDDGAIIESLGLLLKDNINNGGFDVRSEWVTLLQPHFKNKIEIDNYWCQISFDYRDENW